LQLHVYFTPADLASVTAHQEDIYIVVDVIRATTTLVTLFERGARRVFIADTLDQAQAAAHNAPERLLCGERNALPLPGFDYGNSPAQFSLIDLSGRDLVLTTTNGTRAFYACPQHSIRLAGCFYNAAAVTAYALQQAEKQASSINIVCAAESGYFALDDATCAGYLALELQRQHPTLQVHESVYAAIALYQTYTLPDLLKHCNSARSVAAAGLQDDLDFCIQISKSTSIPLIAGIEAETRLLEVEKAYPTDPYLSENLDI
jgi:2-phosphosulfolactate phosphatase